MNPSFPYNLVPCERAAFPTLAPLYDLTHNLETAQAVVEIVQAFFRFEPPGPIYSGWARRATPYDGTCPLLCVQLWEDGEVLRTVAYRNVGYVGVLHLEASEVRYMDLVYETLWGYSENGKPLCSGSATEVMALVESTHLKIPIPWNP